jgi:Protein of unknown function (DUF1453)
MTFASIAFYIALAGLFFAKRIKGEPVATDKKLFLLPIILVVLGWGQISHGSMNTVATVLTIFSAAVALGMGVLRGAVDKLTVRDGAPFMRWGRASVIVFLANVAIKLVLDVVLLAAGGTAAAAADSLTLVFGLTLLAEAGTLWLRLQPRGWRETSAIGAHVGGR